MTRNSNAHMRDGFVLAESDLVDFLSGSTDSAINFSGSADLHTPIHPPPLSSIRLKLLVSLSFAFSLGKKYIFSVFILHACLAVFFEP